jgi:hypothetical protein
MCTLPSKVLGIQVLGIQAVSIEYNFEMTKISKK